MKTENTQATPAAPLGASMFFITGLVFLVLAMAMLAGRPAFPGTPVLTGHGLAWLVLMIFGAGLNGAFGLVYRAVPESLGARLYSDKFVVLHYAFHQAGILLVLGAVVWPDFGRGSMGTTLVMAGAIVCGVNLMSTFGRPAKPDVASAYLVVSTLWVVIAAFLGTPFVSNPALTTLNGSSWSEAWLMLAIAGVLINVPMGLALRASPAGMATRGLGGAWYGLFLSNAGIAWMFPGIAYRAPGFQFLCALVYLAGVAVHFAAFWGLFRRGGLGAPSWDNRILLTSFSLVPVAVVFVMVSDWARLTAPPPEAVPGVPPPVVEPSEGVLPLEFLPSDGAAVLTALLAVAVPAIVALGFRLVRFGNRAREDGLRARLGEQILLAAYFNYATGVLLVVPGAWLNIEKMLGLGSLFVLVGALGFLGNYLFVSGTRPLPEPSGESSRRVAA